MDPIIISILQTRTMKLRETKVCAQGHTAGIGRAQTISLAVCWLQSSHVHHLLFQLRSPCPLLLTSIPQHTLTHYWSAQGQMEAPPSMIILPHWLTSLSLPAHTLPLPLP